MPDRRTDPVDVLGTLGDKFAMATNTFVEFRLDDAQPLADYTSIAFDLRSARDFATTILEENRNPYRIFHCLTRSWLLQLSAMQELLHRASD